MITKSARDLDEAMDLYSEFRPDASQRARRVFAGKAARHFQYDYRGSKGLTMVGYADCECINSIIFDDFQDDEFGVEVSYSVTVLTENGPERFDSDEALGYNTFIQAAPHREELQAAIIRTHLENKRAEKCEE